MKLTKQDLVEMIKEELAANWRERLLAFLPADDRDPEGPIPVFDKADRLVGARDHYDQESTFDQEEGALLDLAGEAYQKDQLEKSGVSTLQGVPGIDRDDPWGPPVRARRNIKKRLGLEEILRLGPDDVPSYSTPVFEGLSQVLEEVMYIANRLLEEGDTKNYESLLGVANALSDLRKMK